MRRVLRFSIGVLFVIKRTRFSNRRVDVPVRSLKFPIRWTGTFLGQQTGDFKRAVPRQVFRRALACSGVGSQHLAHLARNGARTLQSRRGVFALSTCSTTIAMALGLEAPRLDARAPRVVCRTPRARRSRGTSLLTLPRARVSASACPGRAPSDARAARARFAVRPAPARDVASNASFDTTASVEPARDVPAFLDPARRPRAPARARRRRRARDAAQTCSARKGGAHRLLPRRARGSSTPPSKSAPGSWRPHRSRQVHARRTY